MPETSPGPRATRQRAAVLAALERADGFKSAQELFDELRADGVGIGLTTVYRTLQLLAEGDELDVLRSDDGEAFYRRCAGSDHHHHLVCRSCRTSVEIASEEIESWTAQIASRHRFVAPTHRVEVYGVCERCASGDG